MTFDDAYDLVAWLNRRFREAGMRPWYLWAVPITWDKLQRWGQLLGYRGSTSR